MAAPSNADVVCIFEKLADLLEIKGEDSFRVSSYRRVARTLADVTEPLTAIDERGELTKLPGIGKGSAERIHELLATGDLELLRELCSEVPETLLQLLEIPSMGPKKVALLWRERGICSLDELRAALDSGQLVGLKGFGDKTLATIRDGIDFLQRSAGRVRIGVAWPIAQQMRAQVAGLPGVKRVEHAGSLRRGQETIGDLDLLCIAADGAAVIQAFTQLPEVRKVLVAGDTKGSVLVPLDGGKELQVDLRVVPETSFGAAWQYFTGSKEHNVRLRERATKRGWTLNEYALSEIEGGQVVASATEEEIYARLDLPWIPPELREDRGEFALPAPPDGLLTLADMRGDLHLHTTASDGKATIVEMIEGAIARGYAYICITDHSQSSVIANGLKPDRLRTHIRDVRAAAGKYHEITVWIGAEVDILGDATLDYEDGLLAELDWVVASVHVGMSKDAAANTRRTLAAIENPYVNVIAHPTGRLIGTRDAMPLDFDAVFKAAADSGTALEINASSYRLDLKDVHARQARAAGVTICIDTDAHSVPGLDHMQFGVLTARRAGLQATDVLNTWPAEQIRTFVARKRSRHGVR